MIKRFEDLPVWQDSRKLTKLIYQITSSVNFENDFRLVSQIRSSSVSIMSNIAEGFENQSSKQFIRYLYIARGSSGELRSQIYVAYDAGYIDKKKMDEIKNYATDISRQCMGLIYYLEKYESSSNIVKEPNEDVFLDIINN